MFNSLHEDIIMKTVHKEKYKNCILEIEAGYFQNYARKIGGKWYHGEVVLRRTIENAEGTVIDRRLYGDSLIGRDVMISFRPLYKKVGPFKFERRDEVEHISDVYEKELQNFIDDSKRFIDRIVLDNNQQRRDQQITDELPESLHELKL